MDKHPNYSRAMMVGASENADGRPRFGPPPAPSALRPGDLVRRPGLDEVYVVACYPFEFDGRMHVNLKKSSGRRGAKFAGCALVESLTKVKE